MRDGRINDRGQTPRPLPKALTAALYVGSAATLAVPKVMEMVGRAGPKRWNIW